MTAGLDPDRFRFAMGHLPTAVTVVTARDDAGAAHGMTVSAVTSLSLEPPLLLVCIDAHAAIHDLLTRAPVFGVDVLAHDQELVARRFADRGRHRYDDHTGEASPAGLPIVPGALAHFDVHRTSTMPGGDHAIVIGTVVWERCHSGRPLCYFRSGYTELAR